VCKSASPKKQQQSPEIMVNKSVETHGADTVITENLRAWHLKIQLFPV